jgi:flagellar secretion chaperone FliS
VECNFKREENKGVSVKMAVNNPYQAYQNNTVTTASPGELTLMLYNGCLKFIQLAKKGIQDKNVELKNTNIQKAQNIVSELMVTLNMDMEVSKNMMSLYDFINRSLIEANIKNDVKALEEAEGLIVEFRDTWKQLIQVNRQKQHAGQGGRV